MEGRYLASLENVGAVRGGFPPPTTPPHQPRRPAHHGFVSPSSTELQNLQSQGAPERHSDEMDFFDRFRSGKNQSDLATDPAGTKSGKTPKVTEKRREQLRKAQRAHRERSRAYQETLEQEIISLRAHDSRQLQACKAENAFLRELLQTHNIPVPDLPEWREDGVATQVCIDQQHPERAFIQVQRPVTPSRSQGGLSLTLASTPHTHLSPGSSHASQDTFNSPADSNAASPGLFLDPGLVQIGINFILYLEHPCMRHAHLLSGRQKSNNHAFTGSTAMFSFSQQAPEELVESARQGKDATWLSPNTQLASLMELCDQFIPDGEIAPVQMWQKVATALQAERMPVQNIPALQQSLGDIVECRGFGAAMEEQDFEQLLNGFCKS